MMSSIMNETQLKEFECPICNMYLGKPIYQCLTGHSVCSDCKKKMTKCPFCQQNYGNTRNYIMENLLEKVSAKCKNLRCPEMIILSNFATHLSKCKFKAVVCKATNCKAELESSQLQGHINSAHKSIIVKNNTFLASHQIAVSIIEYDKKMFWVRRHIDNGLLFWTAQSVLAIDTSEKYICVVKFIKEDTNDFQAIEFQCVNNAAEDETKLKADSSITVRKSKIGGAWKIQICIRKARKELSSPEIIF